MVRWWFALMAVAALLLPQQSEAEESCIATFLPTYDDTVNHFAAIALASASTELVTSAIPCTVDVILRLPPYDGPDPVYRGMVAHSQQLTDAAVNALRSQIVLTDGIDTEAGVDQPDLYRLSSRIDAVIRLTHGDGLRRLTKLQYCVDSIRTDAAAAKTLDVLIADHQTHGVLVYDYVLHPPLSAAFARRGVTATFTAMY